MTTALVMAEGFDEPNTTIPINWMDLGPNTGLWNQQTSSNHPAGLMPYSGSMLFKFNSYSAPNGQTDILRFTLNMVGVANGILTFMMAHDSGSPSNADRIEWLIGTTNDMSSAQSLGFFNRYSATAGAGGSWTQHQVSIPSLFNNIETCYVWLKGYSTYSNSDIYIDSLTVTGDLITEYAPLDLTRIRWSADGTIPYYYTGSNNTRQPDPGGGLWNAATMLRMDDDNVNAAVGGWGAYYANDGWPMLNFPDVLNVTGFGLRLTRLGYAQGTPLSGIVITGSLDSQDGTDGTWFPVANLTHINGQYAIYQLRSQIPVRWLRFYQPGSQFTWNALHILGAYQRPLLEFWAPDKSAKLTSMYALTYPDASNALNYNQALQFRIKNLNRATHNYYLTVEPDIWDKDDVIGRFLFLVDGTSVFNQLIPAMISNTSPSGQVSAINNYGNPWRPFDGDDTTYELCYYTGNSGWYQYKFANPTVCRAFLLSVRGYNYAPLGVKLVASNTGAFAGEEVTLFSKQDYTYRDWKMPVITPFVNSVAYLYYRWIFTGVTVAGNYATFKSIGLYDVQIGTNMYVTSAAGDFSPVITLAGIIPKTANPADGPHYFSINAKEIT